MNLKVPSETNGELSLSVCLPVYLRALWMCPVEIVYSLEDSNLDFPALSSLWKRKEQLLHITVHISSP